MNRGHVPEHSHPDGPPAPGSARYALTAWLTYTDGTTDEKSDPRRFVTANLHGPAVNEFLAGMAARVGERNDNKALAVTVEVRIEALPDGIAS